MILTNKIKFNKEEKVLIQCDFNFSPKCKRTYYKIYKNVLDGRVNNNGMDRCIQCFNSMTKCGENNFNFKYHKNDSFFEIIDNELKAYLLGWVAGDGCLKKDGLYISVHPMDVAILELFRDTLCHDKKISYRKDDNTVNLIINSVKIMKDLCKHLKLKSYGKKSYDINFPDLNRELLISFIRGLIDSDGSIKSIGKGTGPSCVYCSMSEKIKTQLIDFCSNENIKCVKSEHSVIFSGKNAMLFMDLIYNNSNYHLIRKKSMYKLWTTWKYKMGHCIKSRTPNKNKKRGYSYIPSEKHVQALIAIGHNKRLLPPTDVNDIKVMLKNKIPQAKIAKKYNISQSTISNIKLGKIYKD